MEPERKEQRVVRNVVRDRPWDVRFAEISAGVPRHVADRAGSGMDHVPRVPWEKLPAADHARSAVSLVVVGCEV